MPLYKHYRVFISSPGDVEQERNIAEKIINNVSRVLKETINVCLDVIRWEQFPPEMSEESIQKRINDKVATCDFFLLILNKRYGSTEPGQPISNTEREVNAMIASRRKFIFLTYCKKVTEIGMSDVQFEKLQQLKQRLGCHHNALMKEYRSVKDFEEQFTHHLYEKILSEQTHIYKIDKLKLFWSFGSVENSNRPEVLIVYPPIPRKWMAADDDKHFWHKRLQPNVFFEDFKAISKIAKMMNLVQAKFKVYSNYTYKMVEADNLAKNIIWICLPRQSKAIDDLNTTYPNRRFEITKRKKTASSHIRWTDKDGRSFVIQSPLNTYLQIQRSHINSSTEWNSRLRNIIAKDYAIVARFKKAIHQEEEWTGTKVKEYYIAGIHGLGTWGATCFLDRHYHSFNYDTDEDIQMLLEVIYENGVVKDVIDVSEELEEYFAKENDPSYIKNVIKRFETNESIELDDNE